MDFQNDSEKLDIFLILIGQFSSNNLYLHDFKILLDNNPLVLNIMKKNVAAQIFNEKISDNAEFFFVNLCGHKNSCE